MSAAAAAAFSALLLFLFHCFTERICCYPDTQLLMPRLVYAIRRSKKGCARKAGLNSTNPRQAPLLLLKSASESEILSPAIYSHVCVSLFAMSKDQKWSVLNSSYNTHDAVICST